MGNIVGFYFHSMDGTYIDIPWENAETMQTDPDALEIHGQRKQQWASQSYWKLPRAPLKVT